MNTSSATTCKAEQQRIIHVAWACGAWRVISLLVTLLVLILAPESAWALQTHGPPEGFYVHQMAHVLYAGSLFYLARDVRRSALGGQGWQHLRIFCFLMIVWNIVALLGHFAERILDSSAFATINGYLSLHLVAPIDWIEMLFYLATLDHLINVPAIFYLLLALRAFHRQMDSTGTESRS